MAWLAVVLLGHFSNAGAFVIDKILLTKSIKHPTVYVFFVGLLGALAVVLVPFAHLTWLPAALLLQSAAAGISFMVALLCFFSALQIGNASRVVPIVGALVPLWTLGFASGYLGENLDVLQLYGVALLIVGAILISYEDTAGNTPLGFREALLTVTAAGLFAFSYTMTKVVFNQTSFLNGFLWMRLFSLLTVLPLLLLPTTRRAIFTKESNERPSTLFFVGQALGAGGFLFLNIGLKLAPEVSVVNALQGIQYAFLFILVYGLSRWRPTLLRESWSRRLIVQKTIALVVLGAGLVLATV